MDVDDDRDLSEFLRLAVIFGLLAVDCWILWDAVKERPEMLVLRAKARELVVGPWRKYKETRKAESHVVWEAMEVVSRTEEEHEHGN